MIKLTKLQQEVVNAIIDNIENHVEFNGKAIAYHACISYPEFAGSKYNAALNKLADMRVIRLWKRTIYGVNRPCAHLDIEITERFFSEFNVSVRDTIVKQLESRALMVERELARYERPIYSVSEYHVQFIHELYTERDNSPKFHAQSEFCKRPFVFNEEFALLIEQQRMADNRLLKYAELQSIYRLIELAKIRLS